uniref:Neurotransmitter-gated ion-channel ligand-binding domain-containing protein n=1 Tax=Anopheles epiroticus TaxID=199890 RepID=A0A182P286_9DIPT
MMIDAGYHEKRLLHNLLDNYNVLERPVVNESDPLQLSFGLTLMQIIDVVPNVVSHGHPLHVELVARHAYMFFFLTPAQYPSASKQQNAHRQEMES